MKYLLILLPLSFYSCSTDVVKAPSKNSKVMSKKNSKKEIKSCICMEIYQPVCARDGTTYANACEASCQGLSFKNGECR
ncbi:hypothetical protein A9Q84_15730 [Halobacteriovorax marinus]|uniref:Kazal-like domain-containing protein n=1 Tax=Halobacteriovorax marinus TaxID=97084 RepID=A0A1Y5F9E3_9BACT|nr:hypothetical protein A9Q84_15730 [Halobacteriovorax marinus]